MAQHLAETGKLEAPRRMRFSDQYIDDLTALLNSITVDIIQRYSKVSTSFDNRWQHEQTSIVQLLHFIYSLAKPCDF